MSEWVQHISGQGKKFEVLVGQTEDDFWVCQRFTDDGCFPWLPRSEYRKCPPPRRRVTRELTVEEGHDKSSILRLPGRWSNVPRKCLYEGHTWKLVTREELAEGEVAIVIEEGA